MPLLIRKTNKSAQFCTHQNRSSLQSRTCNLANDIPTPDTPAALPASRRLPADPPAHPRSQKSGAGHPRFPQFSELPEILGVLTLRSFLLAASLDFPLGLEAHSALKLLEQQRPGFLCFLKLKPLQLLPGASRWPLSGPSEAQSLASSQRHASSSPFAIFTQLKDPFPISNQKTLQISNSK
jgi:hypothetical protein